MVLIMLLVNIILSVVSQPVEVNHAVISPQGNYQVVLTQVPQTEYCEYLVTKLPSGDPKASGRYVQCNTSFWVVIQGKQIFVSRFPKGGFGLGFIDGDPFGSPVVFASLEWYIANLGK